MDCSDDEDDEVMDINDSRVPHVVREHGRRFKKSAKFVVEPYPEEYILFSEDGDMLDMVSLT